MPYLNTIGGGSARKFGFTRRSQFYKCLADTSIVTLNINTLQCTYPPNYAATSFTYSCQQTGCWSGGGIWGSEPNAGCCGCEPCPFNNCVGCFSIYCTCYDPGWNPLGNVGQSPACYQPYTITTTCTGYSCPTNSPPATLSGTTCVYPPTYTATLVDA